MAIRWNLIGCFLLIFGMCLPLAWAQTSATPVAIRAEDLPPLNTPPDAKQEEMKEKARKRLYPGGSEEEDLRVQTDLSLPTKAASDAVQGNTTEWESEGF